MASLDNPHTPQDSQDDMYGMHFLSPMGGGDSQPNSMDGSPSSNQPETPRFYLGHAVPHYSPTLSQDMLDSPIGYQTDDGLGYRASLAGNESDFGVDDASSVGGDFHSPTAASFAPQVMQLPYSHFPPPQTQQPKWLLPNVKGNVQHLIASSPTQLSSSIVAKQQASRYRSETRSPTASNTTSRVTKRKAKKAPATPKVNTKNPVPKLELPLSKLTADYHDIPVKDMGAWVNRSTEDRKQESAKRDGYVTRPMNSFMLYRSAYAERTKKWCSENNHQVVSAVCGQSWPLEPEEIRLQYEEYAKIERENHQKAHPGYKFSPTKAQANRKKKTSKKTEQAEEASEMEDDMMSIDGDDRSKRGGSHGRRSRPASANFSVALAAHESMIANSPPYDNGASKSSFQATNPGRIPPPNIGHEQHSSNGQYLQTYVQTEAAGGLQGVGVIENVSIRRTQGPARVESMNDGHEMGYSYSSDQNSLYGAYPDQKHSPGYYDMQQMHQMYDDQGRAHLYEAPQFVHHGYNGQFRNWDSNSIPVAQMGQMGQYIATAGQF